MVERDQLQGQVFSLKECLKELKEQHGLTLDRNNKLLRSETSLTEKLAGANRELNAVSLRFRDEQKRTLQLLDQLDTAQEEFHQEQERRVRAEAEVRILKQRHEERGEELRQAREKNTTLASQLAIASSKPVKPKPVKSKPEPH